MMEYLDIKLIRKNLEWSQHEMAEYLGVNRSTVSRIETGRPCSGSVRRLLEMLICSKEISRPCAGEAGEVDGATRAKQKKRRKQEEQEKQEKDLNDE